MQRFSQKLIENALLKRVLGYTYTETRTETGSDGKEKTVVTERQSEPDVRSILFWLTNRYPKRWSVRPVDDGDSMVNLIQLVNANRKAAETVADDDIQ